jgi:hypothetical protein
MAVIRENKLGDCDAYPINPSKDPYKSNISITIKLMKAEIKMKQLGKLTGYPGVPL